MADRTVPAVGLGNEQRLFAFPELLSFRPLMVMHFHYLLILDLGRVVLRIKFLDDGSVTFSELSMKAGV